MTTTQKIHKAFNSLLKPVTVENEYKPKIKVIKRFKSCFYETLKPYKTVKWNTHMDYLVKLPSGQNVWMTEKEVNEIKAAQLPKT